MKRVLFGFLGLLLALLTALLVAPGLFDWNTQKSRIAAEVRAATGRDLEIAGDVSLSLLPAPALTASGVTMANLPDGSAPAMVSLRALRVRVALLPLLAGRIRVESVALVEPQILLEVLPDGRRNWDFAREVGAADTAPAAPEEAAVPYVRVDDFTISDGTVIYRDAAAGIEERIEDLEAEFSAGSLAGPFLARGSATVRGLDGDFEMSLGRLSDRPKTQLALFLSLREGATKARFSGLLVRGPDGPGLRGTLRTEGRDLRVLAAVSAAEPAHPLPEFLAAPFSATATLSLDRRRADIGDLALALGETSFEGEAEIRLTDPLVVTASLGAQHLDLDGLLAEAAVPAAPATLPRLPRNLTARLQLSVEAAAYRGQLIQQLRLSAALENGQLAISQALALLPGGSDVSLSGTLVEEPAGPRFSGRLEAASDNLRTVLAWLGFDVGSVPSDRLRRTSVSSRIALTPQQLSLSEIDLRLDVSRASGGLIVALRERPAIGLGLAIDSVNLDAYHPAAGGGAQQLAPAGSAFLSTFDANLDLWLGSVTLEGMTAAALHLDATLQDGAVSVRDASVANFAGTAMSFTGRFADLTGAPTVDGTMSLQVDEPERAAKLFGLDAEVARRLGRGELTGRLAGSASELQLELQGRVLGGSGGLSGMLRPFSGRPEVDMILELAHPDLTLLSERLLGSDAAPAGLGALVLSARLSGTPAAIAVTELSGAAGPMELSGSFGLARGATAVELVDLDLAVGLRHGDLSALVNGLTGSSTLPQDLGAVVLQGRLSGAPPHLVLDQLSGALGPLEVAGSLEGDVSGSRPALTGVALTLAVDHPELGPLVEALGVPLAADADLGPVALRAALRGTPSELRLSEVSGRVGPLDLSGSLELAFAAAMPSVTAADFTVALMHPDLASLMRALPGSPSLDPLSGVLDLRGHVTGGRGRFQVERLAGRIGSVQLSGSLGLDLLGPRPAVTLAATSGDLPVSPLFAPALSEAATATGRPATAAAGDTAGRWSTAPIDLGPLTAFDAEIALSASALVAGRLRLEQAVLQASLEDGVLDLKELTGKLHGGAIAVIGALDARQRPQLGVAVTAIGLQLDRLLPGTAEHISGPLTVQADFTTNGRSAAELVAGLVGGGDFSASLDVRAKPEDESGSLLYDLLGLEAERLRGLVDALALLVDDLAAAPARLAGSFAVRGGLATTEDTRIEGRGATVETNGTVNLPAWELNLVNDLYRSGDAGSPYLTVRLSGPIDGPNVRVSGRLFQRLSAPDDHGAADAGPEKTESRLRDLLKGLAN